MTSATPYKPTADEVKRLREETGVGMIDCRNALVKASGDFAAAKRGLDEVGATKAAKKAERTTSEGLVASYIHAGGKIGALVEINCETDFVARNDRFRELARDIAMHVTAMSPEYLNRESVPEAVLAAQRDEIAKSVPPGKPAPVAEKIVEGRLAKWYEERVLLDQPFVKDDEQTVAELIASVVAVLGENIQVRRFAKFALGDR